MNDDIQDLICIWVNDKQGWDTQDKKGAIFLKILF